MATMFGRTRRRPLLNLRHWKPQLKLLTPSQPTLRFPTANLAAFILCYFIGAYGFSSLLILPIIVTLYLFWVEQHTVLEHSVELAFEEKLSRKKVTETPESLEWVNFAFSRWSVYIWLWGWDMGGVVVCSALFPCLYHMLGL